MNNNKYSVTGKDKQGIKKTAILNHNQMIEILLNFAGGGYTENQTRKAIIDYHTLRDSGMIKRKYKNTFYTFKLLPE